MALLEYSGLNVVMFGKILLKPGLNEINSKDFKSLSAHPCFKKRVEAGMIIISASSIEPEDCKDLKEIGINIDPEDYEGLKPSMKSVQKSKDLEFLKKIIEKDDREKIVQAAMKRMIELSKGD